MAIRKFPDPRTDAGPEGLLALGGDLEPESLLLAYRQGIFPWPVEGLPLAWFCPPERAILEFDRLHLPRSLRAFLRKHRYRLSIDTAFEEVIAACADVPRPHQPVDPEQTSHTWITEEMEEAYVEFHRRGHAHSVEVWEGDELVGGIYGVEFDGCFAGESMFHLRPNTSKLALLHLVEHLRLQGCRWMDIQMMTPHLERLGARPIPRDKFLDLLESSRRPGVRLFSG
jgi:leucyl/phenylalanyl-tRNA--protein transferase